MRFRIAELSNARWQEDPRILLNIIFDSLAMKEKQNSYMALRKSTICREKVKTPAREKEVHQFGSIFISKNILV